MHVDVQKRFPIYPVCPKTLGGPSLRRGDTKERGNFHCELIQHPENPKNR